MNKSPSILFSILRFSTAACLLPSWLWAQQGEEGVNASEGRLPEEIVIFGKDQPRFLNKAIRQAEVALYDMFNEINDDDRYDIHCRFEAPLGSRIKSQYCRPNFYYEATSTEGSAVVSQLQGFGGVAPPAVSVISYEAKILEKKIRQALEENADFREALRYFNDLKEERRERDKEVLLD